MEISLIVAMASNRAIGKDNRMPWHLSADLKRFKQTTMGHPIIMGRKTFEAVGRPLPGRTNIIISRNSSFKPASCVVANSVEAAIQHGCSLDKEVFIIGGAAIYNATLPLANNLYITLINKDFEGDTFFPEIDYKEWAEVKREEVEQDTNVDFSYCFVQLKKR